MGACLSGYDFHASGGIRSRVSMSSLDDIVWMRSIVSSRTCAIVKRSKNGRPAGDFRTKSLTAKLHEPFKRMVCTVYSVRSCSGSSRRAALSSVFLGNGHLVSSKNSKELFVGAEQVHLVALLEARSAPRWVLELAR